SPFDGAQAVLVHRRDLLGDPRGEVHLRLPRLERRRFEERDLRVEEGLVSGRGDVFGDRVREPEQVVGAAGPGSLPGGGVPPVLDVASAELAGGRGGWAG